MGEVVEKEYNFKDGLYVLPCRLAQMFGMGRTTIYTLTKEMRTYKKYRYSFKDLGHKLKLVKVEDFEQFLQEKSDRRLRGKE